MQLSTVAMSTPKALPLESLLIGDAACSQIRELLGASVVPAIRLDLDRQALSGISAVLRQRRNEAGPPRILHLLAHGRPGAFRIGDQWIDAEALKAHAGDLASWGVETIALWSCHVGADANFVALLQEFTGAQVLTASSWLGRDGHGKRERLQLADWHLAMLIAEHSWPNHFRLEDLDDLVGCSCGKPDELEGSSGRDVFRLDGADVVTNFEAGIDFLKVHSGADVRLEQHGSDVHVIEADGTTHRVLNTTIAAGPLLLTSAG